MLSGEGETAYSRVQRLIEKSEIWGQQFYYTVDAAMEDLPARRQRSE